MMGVGFIRRWYAGRILKFIDKSKKKKRRLPDHLYEIDLLLRRVPGPKRRSTLEEMLVPRDEAEFGRELRRAATRQSRQSGRGGPGRRPGTPPQSVRRPTKGPR